ncbi:TetR/AcrR family transcriptional regulator [Faecalicatena contorta]|uniref:DNA-binding transcriptional regulator, AcrR family n=1 Tax=Faecalicatena contorta TaxID=39482 RepID=A0A315ZYQ0_9FIRM|nr:TetR/AcrR family transcriptional regulator [Faecalicatena contorta]PWJ50362.1 TetR family transcriptional regulator [Faecalicatena contorta]SUQ13770.1 DNA-binding transcriptional regulator, AcrR family [Faecalicatena contorta]
MNGYEKRTQEKKNQVLKAAFELMNTDTGTETLTMDEIAKKSNVGKTSIFKYFGSKENLIFEVFKNFLGKMEKSALEIMAENKPFEETIIAIAQNKIHYLDKINKRFYLDLMDFFTQKGNDGLSLMIQQYNKESFRLMLDLFHRGRKEGKVDLKYSDEFLLVYFQALVEGISAPHVYREILPYTAQWTELLIKGLAPSK